MASDPQRILATYRLAPTAATGPADRGRGGEKPGAPGRDDALGRARAVARESTLEVPEGVAPDEVETRLLGRVESLEPEADGAWRAVLSHAPAILDGGLPQLLNVIHGNISLLPGVRLVDLALPEAVLAAFPGPRAGIQGIREAVGGEAAGALGRPLVAAAIKPVGLGVEELARLAAAFARAGVDVIKDDHSLADQATAPFGARARAVAAAVEGVNRDRGGHTRYFVNVTGPVDRLAGRLATAREAGCGGVLVCPGLVGMDAVRVLAEAPEGLPVMAHPSRADVAPDRDSGIAPEILFGTLYRLIGADAVVYVNAGGRFAWSVEDCQAVNARLRGPLGSLRPAFPVPAGGVDAEEAPAWFRRYGPDTLLLIGGSLLKEADVEGAARRLVLRAREAGAAPVTREDA